MPPVPFASVFRTADVGEAETHLRSLYGALELHTDDIRVAQRVRGDDAFTLTELDYVGRLDVAGDIDLITVAIATGRGAMGWEVGRESGLLGREPVMFRPHERVVCHVDDTSLRAATFDAAALRSAAAALFADDRLRIDFASARPRSRELGALWASTLELASSRDVVASELLHATVRSTLTRLTLEAFPLAGEREARRAGAVAGWHGYVRATRFIDEHASLPITLADIAAAAGLPASALDEAFRLHTPGGVSALEYLEQCRLSAARDDLLSGDPERAGAVAMVARRWGFASVARFRQLFRRTYGVDPGRALRH